MSRVHQALRRSEQISDAVTVTLDQRGMDPSPGFHGIIEALFRQRWKMLLVMTAVVALVLYWEFGTPRRFASEMILLVQNARGNEVVTSTPSENSPVSTDVSDQRMNTEVAILASNDILDQVVDPEWNQRSPDTLPKGQLLNHQRAVQSLHGRLDVSGVRGSHAISVKLIAESPEIARTTLVDLLKAYLRKQTDLRRLPGASAVFSQQADQYKKHLEAARHDLAEYQNSHGFVSLVPREQALEAKLLDLQKTAWDTDAQISEMQDRINTGRQEIAATSERRSTTEQSSPATGTVDQLNVLLVTLKNRRTELLTKFTPDDRLVREVDQQISDTMAGLKQATNIGVRQVSTDVNPLWQASQRDLSGNMVMLAGLVARRKTLTSQIASLGSELSDTELQSGTFDALEERITELESSYQAFVQKRANSFVSDLMDEQRWLNVAVVQYPTRATSPTHPLPVRDLTLGFLTALILGGCSVFFFESIRQKISTPAELEAVSRYAVLATIPYVSLTDTTTHTDLLEPRDLLFPEPNRREPDEMHDAEGSSEPRNGEQRLASKLDVGE